MPCPLDRRGLLSQRQARSIKKCEVATTTAFLVVGFSEFCLISKRRVNQPPNTKHPKRNNNWRRHKSPPAPPTKQSALAQRKNDRGVYSASEDSHWN